MGTRQTETYSTRCSFREPDLQRALEAGKAPETELERIEIVLIVVGAGRSATDIPAQIGSANLLLLLDGAEAASSLETSATSTQFLRALGACEFNRNPFRPQLVHLARPATRASRPSVRIQPIPCVLLYSPVLGLEARGAYASDHYPPEDLRAAA
jgi:hypothetical protein